MMRLIGRLCRWDGMFADVYLMICLTKDVAVQCDCDCANGVCEYCVGEDGCCSVLWGKSAQ